MNAEGQAQPGFPDLLGQLYKRWVLDCVVSAAFAVSKDFSDRLELYQDVDVNVADYLTALQGLYGFDPAFPSDEIRKMLMRPIFGPSDGYAAEDESSKFHNTRRDVIEAARAFSENAQAAVFSMLRERFLSALVPFRTFVTGRKGVSFTKTEERTAKVFDLASGILKDKNVRVVFGINNDIDAAWPLDSTDPNGAQLIENITHQLTQLPHEPVSLDRFVRLQRIAQKGQESLSGVADPGFDEKNADALIARFYAWGSDLGILART
jgi:hypothetical protein